MIRLLPALLASLSLSASAQFQGWIVDDDGGVGVHSTTIQGAIDAASEGDLILVRDGTYGAFVIDGKSLTVLSDIGHFVVLSAGNSRIANLGPQQHVQLRGLNVVVPRTEFSKVDALRIESCQGTIWIEECLIEGGVCFPFFCSSGAAALRVTDCAGVLVQRSTLRGGETLDGGLSAGDAVELVRSSISFHECIVGGGQGLAQFPSPTPIVGADGGTAVRMEDSFFYAATSTFEAGKGADGASGDTSPCSDGGDGGYTLFATSGTSSYALLESQLFPGLPGLADTGCVDGAPGALIDPGGATPAEQIIQEDGRLLQVTSPVEPGDLLLAFATGAPGDQMFLFIALSPQFQVMLSLDGVLYVPSSSLFVPMGIVGPTGALFQTLGAPGLPPGFDFLDLYVQLVWIEPDASAGLGAPSVLTIKRPVF